MGQLAHGSWTTINHHHKQRMHKGTHLLLPAHRLLTRRDEGGAIGLHPLTAAMVVLSIGVKRAIRVQCVILHCTGRAGVAAVVMHN